MQLAVFITFGLIFLWLIAIYPGRGRDGRMEPFTTRMIAHRGFHDNARGVPENSRKAFSLACEMGYGIELDVRETSDEALVIMHDPTLLRAAGDARKVSEVPLSEIRRIKLFHSEETVPRFDEVLRIIGGKVPLVVEIKADTLKDTARICEHTAFFLDAYDGTYCIESFNPKVLRWFRKNRPETLRGQLSEKFGKSAGLNPAAGFLAGCCAFNFLTKPDFIAYNKNHAHLLRYRILHGMFHACGLAWTIRSPEELKAAAPSFEGFIFEGFEPPVRTGTEKNSASSADGERNAGSEGSRKEKAGSMKHVIRKHMLVSGTVTAVGFRYRATWIAQSLGITGWVRNTWDDRVEMEVQGTEREISEMMKRLGEQRYIEITNVDEKIIPAVPSEYEFKVRY